MALWKKGQSGNPKGKFKKGDVPNPKGRPKNPFPALIRKKSKNGKLIARKMWNTFMNTNDADIRHKYGIWLRDTGWGRPVEQIRALNENGDEIPFVPVVYVPAKKRS